MNLIVDIYNIHVCFLTVPVKFFNVFFIFFLYLNLKRTELQCNLHSCYQNLLKFYEHVA